MAWAMALIEPAGKKVTASVMASLAEVIATALRAIQAMVPAAQNGHHATAITANAGMNGILHNTNIGRVIGNRDFPRLGNDS